MRRWAVSASANASKSSPGTTCRAEGAALARISGLSATNRVHAASVRSNTSRARRRAARAAVSGARTCRVTAVLMALKAASCSTGVTRTPW